VQSFDGFSTAAIQRLRTPFSVIALYSVSVGLLISILRFEALNFDTRGKGKAEVMDSRTLILIDGVLDAARHDSHRYAARQKQLAKLICDPQRPLEGAACILSFQFIGHAVGTEAGAYHLTELQSAVVDQGSFSPLRR